MESETPENGLEELLQLSQRFNKKAEDTVKQENRKKQELAEKGQVIQGLREITFSMALEQLKIVSAEADIFEKVTAFKTKQDTEGLRKLIVDLMSELEGRTSKMSRSNPELASIERSIKTVSVLVDLFFSLT